MPVSPTAFLRLLAALSFASGGWVSAEGPPRFDRDILPILSDKCFHCHGPDASSRKADLRLDEEAFLGREADSGLALVAPGDPEASELIHRIATVDADEVMPPPSYPKQLTAAEKETLAAWVESGAAWEGHWAFSAPVRPAVPAAAEGTDSIDPIDAFLLERLSARGLVPRPAAAPAAWLRRAALDLTGLPPDPDLAARFFSAPDYGAAVDELLASPRYGERMAWDWLEAARYADTHGYQKDNLRSMWAWRDWVVGAYNENLPFDRFTVEQLAGDLLPEPTTAQLVATGFNRNHRINAEAGAIDEEYRIEYVVDRVDTTATVWMGLTAGCARCHDHKFDPLTQREFFQLAAFFNNIDEKGNDGVAPTAAPDLEIELPGFKEAIAEAGAALALAEAELTVADSRLPAERAAWLADRRALLAGERYWLVVEPGRVGSDSGASRFTPLPDRSQLLGGGIPLNDTHRLSFKVSAPATVGAVRLEALELPGPVQGGLSPSFDGDFHLSEIRLAKNGQAVALRSAASGTEREDRPAAAAIDGDPLTGWSAGPEHVAAGRAEATFVLVEPLALDPADEIEVALAYLTREEQHFIGRFRLSLAVGDGPEDEITQSLAAALGSGDAAALSREFRESDPALAELREQRDLAREAAEETRDSFRTRVMVMRERKGEPRPTHVLDRGLYDQPGEVVGPDVPAFLAPRLPDAAPRDRLALARWLVDPAHPLTARVAANRLWQMLFGTGLVATAEDFGRQGERPSHPELLDYLALELVESGWDQKAMLRRLVLTEAYRRSAAVTPEMIEIDPANRLLASGPWRRLPAPAIRDQALFAGGLLVERIGGPPVRPEQPEGLWEAVAGVNSNTTRYLPDTGEGRFRRSLYTLWKRSVPPPNMLLFDAPGREMCAVGSHRTNTPLQALATLNDPNFALPAVAFARRMVETETDDDARLAAMWRALLVADPGDGDLAILREALRDHRRRYADATALAAERVAPLSDKLGQAPPEDPAELAAWTEIAEILLNLDTTLTPR